MDIANTVSRIAWRIERKPEGGYIARCSDTSVPPLEGATEAEVKEKVREQITAELAAKFPALKIDISKPLSKFASFDTKFDLAVSKPGDPSAQTLEGGVKGAIEHWLTENAVAFVGSQLPPEVIEKLKAQAHEGKVNFTLTTTTRGSGSSQVSTKTISLGEGKPLTFGPQDQAASGALQPSAPVSASFSNPQLDSGSPITPVSSSNSFLRFVLAALVVLGLIFLFAHLKK